MKWLVWLYPAPWRARYNEEFADVLTRQRPSIGLVLDVIGGAIDARLSPQIRTSGTQQTYGDETMTNFLQRCSAGGPKLTPEERRISSRLTILGTLGMVLLYLVLTKVYRGAPAVQALFYTSICTSFAYEQAVYLKDRPRRTRALILMAEICGMYLFMFAICLIASKL